MSMTERAVHKLREQQGQVEEYSAPWMVAEQLMEICRREPESAALIAQDLDNPEMGIVQAEGQIKAYADSRKPKGAGCVCVSPAQAEEVLRHFYGLPGRDVPPKPIELPAGLGLSLSDFLGG